MIATLTSIRSRGFARAVTYDSLGLSVRRLAGFVRAADGSELRLPWTIDREVLVEDLRAEFVDLVQFKNESWGTEYDPRGTYV